MSDERAPQGPAAHARLLAFTEPLEQRFQARRHVQLVRNDLSWCMVMVVFFSVSVAKYDADERRRMPLVEAAMMALWVGWLPVVVGLAWLSPKLYVRYRTPLMMLLRLCRHVTVMNPSLPRREAKWLGSVTRVPQRPLQIYFHLAWKVNSLLFGAVAFITPVRYFLPVQFAMLLLNLYATMHRCAVECGVAPPPAHAVAAWVGECGGDVLPGAASAACPAAVADTEGASAYYKAVVTWIRRLLPLSGSLRMRARALLPLWSRRPGSCCLGSCWAVHGWLQAVGGMLLPLALLWVQEERLRAAELALVAQQQGRRRDAAEAPMDATRAVPPRQGGEGSGGAAPRRGAPDRPLSVATLCGWLVASSWLLWLLLELSFL